MATFESRQPDWVSFREALGRIFTAAPALPQRKTALLEATGLALAEEVRSPLTLPPGPTSHMDGYAVRHADFAGVGASDDRYHRVVGDSLPGKPWRERLEEGSAVRIMTGALLPPGTDTVIPVEHTDRESGYPGRVRVLPPRDREAPYPELGQNVRAEGEEMTEGAVLASPGDTVGFGLLALLAATGSSHLPVHPSPRVALVVTGDELVPAGEGSALEGGIRRADILSPTLPLLFRWAGATVHPPRRAPDDREALREVLREASRSADLVVTTGGASMGQADLVKGVLEDLGCEIDFWRIRMRPGSPVSLGRLPVAGADGTIPVLSLPGNPVSAMVTCLTLALPALRSLGGHRTRFLRRVRATAHEPFRGPPHLTRLFRVHLDRAEGVEWAARSAGPQGSGSFRSMALADGLAVIPEGTPAAERGDPLDVLLLPDSGWTASP
ncbi:MAG: gephyrin-like molybdotransferase Glp [Gemmatimonadota bacterium]